VNMAIVRTSDRATEERGTIIELTVQHKGRRRMLRASLIMVRSWVVLIRKCGYRRDHDKQCTYDVTLSRVRATTAAVDKQ
jgi:hypothetical protein